jgi:hypothetical protein
MRWRPAPKPALAPGEYPESFVKGWMARTLPMATPAEAASAVRHLRGKGWTEEQLAEFILPYMPRDVPWGPAPRGPGGPPAQRARPALPPEITRAWLDESLPGMDRHQMRCVVDELERRGWSSGTVAMAVLPHLLPKLPADDVRAIVAGLAGLGMTEEEIASVTNRA